MRKSTILAGMLSALLPVVPFAQEEGAVAGESPAVILPPRTSPSGDWNLEIWNDPAFKKQFVAGYGINSEIEPRVLPEEVAVLEKLRPLMADDLPKAEALLKKSIKPDSSAVLDFSLGSVHFQQDNLAAALASYNKAVEKFPSFRRAWRNLGLIHVRESRHDEAIRAFTRMIELGGGDAYAYGLLGFAYSARMDFQAAEVAYRNALLLQPDNTDWRVGMTRCVLKQEKHEEAVALLETLISTYPEKGDFWLLQAQAYLGMKQPLKAAQDLEALDRLGKATLDSRFTLGDIYLNEGLMDLAAAAYQRGITADPAQASSRALRAAEMLAARAALPQARMVASALRTVLDGKLAQSDLRKLLKLESRLNLAEGGDSAEAVRALEEIIEMDPLDGEALMLLGQHYSGSQDPDRAVFYYERAAGIESFEASAKIKQAQVFVGMGRHGDAVPLLRRAQEIKPREDVARYLEQVERIAKSK